MCQIMSAERIKITSGNVHSPLLFPPAIWIFCLPLPKEEGWFFSGREVKLVYIIRWERGTGRGRYRKAQDHMSRVWVCLKTEGSRALLRCDRIERKERKGNLISNHSSLNPKYICSIPISFWYKSQALYYLNFWYISFWARFYPQSLPHHRQIKTLWERILHSLPRRYDTGFHNHNMIGSGSKQANFFNAPDHDSTGGFGQYNQTKNWNKRNKIWKGGGKTVIVCGLYNYYIKIQEKQTIKNSSRSARLRNTILFNKDQ